MFTIHGNGDNNVAGHELLSITPVDTIFNESGNDIDFRIESNTNTSAFWINGDGSEVVINDTGQNDTDFRVESNASDPNYTDQGVLHEAHKKTHALFVDTATGRVGLGVDSPQTTLHVAGSAHIEGDLWVKGVTNQLDTLVHVTSAMDITNKGTGPALKVTQTGAQPIAAFYDDDVPQLYLEDGGNIGMSTATPISYDSEADNLVIYGLENVGMTIASPNNKRGNIFFADGTDGAEKFRGGITYDHTDDDMSLRTAGTERVWIKNNGRVGIGKSDPDCDLYIKGYTGNGDETQTALRLITTTSTGNTATAEIGQNDWGGQLVYDTTYDKFSIYTHHNDVAQTNGNDPEGNPRGMGGIHLRNDRGWVGIGSKRPMTSLYIDDTDGLRLPIGTTIQRPVVGATDLTPTIEELYGTVRYNTEYLTFEGFGPGDTWGSLGGVIDIDRDTFWTALNDISGSNSYPGDPDCLRAFVGHNETGLNVNGTGDDEYNTSVPNGTQVMQIGLSSTWFDNDYTGGDGRYRVGIGVHVPGASLDVRGPDGPLTTANDGFVLRAAETEDWLTMGTDSSTRTSWIRAVRSGTGENDLTLQAVGGNVGIGTEAPTTLLNVQDGNIWVTRNEADSGGLDIRLQKSRNATDGSHTIVQDDDILGNLYFQGSDGDNFESAAAIRCEIDGTPGVDDMPGRLLFMTTPNSSDTVTERMRIDSLGNVGIGTTSPVSPTSRDTALVVGSLVGTETSGLTLNNGSSFSNGPWEILTSSEGSSTRLAFNDGTDPRMVISSAGNVGIGTTGPDGPLHVVNTSANTLTLTRKLDVLGSANGASAKIEGGALDSVTPSNGAAIGFCLLDSDGTGVSENTKGYLYFETKDSGGILSEKMRILDNGNVGINCTDPKSLLEVRGAAGAAGNLTLSTAETTVVNGDILGKIEFRAPKESSGTDALLVGASIWAEVDATWTASVNRTDLVFATGATGTATEKMRITHEGNAGVGETPGKWTSSGGTTGRYLDVFKSSEKSVISIASNRDDNAEVVGVLQFVNDGNSNKTTNNGNGAVIANISSSILTDDNNTHDDSGGQLIFATKPDGSSLASRMTIKDDGDISFHSNDITSGKWRATTIAIDKGGTGATSLTDLIALGTHTTGNYMSAITAGIGVSVTHTAGEGSSGAIAIGQAVAIADTPIFTGLSIRGGSATEGGQINLGEGTTAITSGGTGAWSIDVLKDINNTYGHGANKQIMRCHNGGVTGTSLDPSGNLRVKGDVVAFQSSDIRLKDNIKLIDNALDKVKRIDGVEFDWKYGDNTQTLYKGHDVGVIAQQVEEVVPEIVQDRENGFKGVMYEKLVPLLIEGMKEQQSQIETLKEQVELLRRHL